jgi:hypothetical protein
VLAVERGPALHGRAERVRRADGELDALCVQPLRGRVSVTRARGPRARTGSVPGNAASNGATCAFGGAWASFAGASVRVQLVMRVERTWIHTGEELSTRVELGMDLDADDDVPARPTLVLDARALGIRSPRADGQTWPDAADCAGQHVSSYAQLKAGAAVCSPVCSSATGPGTQSTDGKGATLKLL